MTEPKRESQEVMAAITALAKGNKEPKPAAGKPPAPTRKPPVAPAPPAPGETFIDPEIARRRKAQQEQRIKVAKKAEPVSVSAGPVEKGMELAFNPTREKIREVTIIDSIQAKLLPLLDVTNKVFQYELKVALYRYDINAYHELYPEEDFPAQPDVIDDLLYRTAQWQKSRGGKNLERITDIALAQVESQADNEERGIGTNNPFE